VRGGSVRAARSGERGAAARQLWPTHRIGREARAFREIADFYGVTHRLMVKLDLFQRLADRR